MIGSIDWTAVSLAGAFILGAVLATIGVLRVVRAVTAMFANEIRRDHLRPRDKEDVEE